MAQFQRILGIDPGLQTTGYGIIEAQGSECRHIASGTVKSNPKEALSERLLTLSVGLKHIIERYQPETAAIEETFVNVNAASTLKLGNARGAILLTLAQGGLPVSEYAATLVKKSIVGVGRAEKDQVGMMVKILLRDVDQSSHDALDALAIALCHAHHRKVTNYG